VNQSSNIEKYFNVFAIILPVDFSLRDMVCHMQKDSEGKK